MANSEIVSDNNIDSLCIPLGAAVSAKFRGAFCEAIVNKVDKKIHCRVQLDNKKTIKANAEDIIGVINTNNKVKVNLENDYVGGIVLKIIDNSVYHVVFNDDDTGILRRNQLVLKGDRHFKLSECLDRHPLTNPEHFTKAVVNEKRAKDKSEVDEEEFDNEEAKSCSQESMTTVSSSKTRSRQQTVASSASVGTGGSSVTVKTMNDLHKAPVTVIKPKRNANVKYSIGSLVIVNKAMLKVGTMNYEKLDKKLSAFIGLIVPASLFVSVASIIKATQCIVKSFRDNASYIVYKRDIEVILKRDALIKYKVTDPSVVSYIDKCILFYDAKILPDHWQTEQLLPVSDYQRLFDDSTDNDRTLMKNTNKPKAQSPRTSISSLDSSSSDNDNHADNESAKSKEDDVQNVKDEWVARFFGFWEDKGSPINSALEIMGADVDIYRLYELVKDYGGFQKVNSNIRWPLIYHLMKLPNVTSENYQKLTMLYKRYIFPYVDMKKKLGTFEQIRNRRTNDKVISIVKKARPLLTARERREYQLNIKKTEACSLSSQSVGDIMTDKVVSGDEVCGTGSIVGDLSHHSQCSSTSPKYVMEQRQIECDSDAKLNQPSPAANHTFQPGTLVSVACGNDKIYKAKIINHSQDTKTAAKSSPSYTAKSVYQTLTSIDTVSNADSTNSTGNDLRSDLDLSGSTLYRVHYIGWNNRHDETISSDRIIGVLSDTGQDSHSACSSRGSQNRESLYDPYQNLPMSDQQHLQSHNDNERFTSSIPESRELLPDVSDISHDNASPDSDQTTEKETKTEPGIEYPCTDQTLVAPAQLQPITTLKRRRSRSACIVEPDHIIIKRLPIVPESRIIASLNLYKTGDKMPKRPIRKHITTKEERTTLIGGCKAESEQRLTESSVASKRHSGGTDDSDINRKMAKIEMLEKKSTSRIRSPSFSNESISDASTISFRCVDDQSMFYLSQDDDSKNEQQKQHTPTPKTAIKTGNKRGRKPLLHKHDKKMAFATLTPQCKPKSDQVEADSNSSQHSGSAGNGKRVTRSVKTASDQNTVDDNSMQLEDDSQTSQDGSVFQLPSLLQSDINKHGLMTPLATGTPTSSHKGRRPKQRRKNRNSQSNSSAECVYQDSNGETNHNYSFGSTGVCDNNFTQPKDSPIVNNRQLGRSFQRLHPSLIPNDLQKLPPEERVKLLESLIRQTYLNFLDTKDKLKFVEKRISEIKASRANGHSIESDEEKFR